MQCVATALIEKRRLKMDYVVLCVCTDKFYESNACISAVFVFPSLCLSSIDLDAC